MSKVKIIALFLLCTVLLSGCGEKVGGGPAVSSAQETEKNVSAALPSSTATAEGSSALRSFEEGGGAGSYFSMGSYYRRPYLAIDETTELPETLPIYEDEYPTDNGRPLYSFEKLSQKEAEAQMTEYLRIFCELTGQLVPEIKTYVKEGSPSWMDEYWYDDVNEQIFQMQYKGYSLGVRGLVENNPDFREATEEPNEELMLENPFVQAAISYQGIKNPEFKQIQLSEFDHSIGNRRIRIAEPCEDLKSNLIYDYFGSVEIRSGRSQFRISTTLPVPEQPLEEAAVIPFETAKEFIEQEQSAPVVYCEAAYDNRFIYPGHYIPAYKFYLQGEDYIFVRLVPMTEYPIPQEEEMQEYMNETFGEYATESSYEKESDSLSSSAAEPAV